MAVEVMTMASSLTHEVREFTHTRGKGAVSRTRLAIVIVMTSALTVIVMMMASLVCVREMTAMARMAGRPRAAG